MPHGAMSQHGMDELFTGNLDSIEIVTSFDKNSWILARRASGIATLAYHVLLVSVFYTASIDIMLSHLHSKIINIVP